MLIPGSPGALGPDGLTCLTGCWELNSAEELPLQLYSDFFKNAANTLI